MENNDLTVNIALTGHVDHGKSSILGRLLAETRALPDGKLDQLQAFCQTHAKDFEYAYLIDTLEKEQSQGITIDMARYFIRSEGRRFLFIDTPGHLDFIKNMITGSSKADVALLVVDAYEGVQENTLRHAFLLSFLKIPQVIVLVNKMDRIGYSEEKFSQISSAITKALLPFELPVAAILPISAKQGGGIVSLSADMPWYKGFSLWDHLLKFIPIKKEKGPLRLPLQDIYRFSNQGDDRRIYCGTIVSGSLKANDSVVFFPSKREATIVSVESKPSEPQAGAAVGITIAPPLFVERGELICKKEETPPKVYNQFKARLFWMGQEPLTAKTRLQLRIHTCKVPCRIEKILSIFDSTNLEPKESLQGNLHDIVECFIQTSQPIAFDISSLYPETSRFILSDEKQMLGGGIICSPIKNEEAQDQKYLRVLALKDFGDNTLNTARLLENKLTQKGQISYFIELSEMSSSLPLLKMCCDLQILCLLSVPSNGNPTEEILRHHFPYLIYNEINPKKDPTDLLANFSQ